MDYTPAQEAQAQALLQKGDALGAEASAKTGVAYTSIAKPMTSTPSVLSSATGADIVGKQTTKLNQLSSNPVTGTQTTDTTKTDTTKTPTITPTKITLINPTTAQTVSFDNADSNKAAIQNYLSGGYSLSEASGEIPSWMSPGGGSDAASKAKADADAAAADLAALTKNFSSYMVSDADLASQTAGITAMWNARINDMNQINKQREGSINTLGIRLGSRYAGGSGGTFGGIISEEERQGVQRVADLEGQKQAAIAAAKTAAMSQNWSVYSKQVDLAQKAYEDKQKAVVDLQKATADQNKLIADSLHQQKKDYFDQVTKPINDVLASVVKSGAPKEIQDAVQNAPDAASAIQAAGEYLQDVPTSGIVGEYLFYTKQAKLAGQTPVDFNSYQNMDANRKIRVAAAGAANGLSNTVLTKVEGVANQFDGEQIVKDYNTTATQVTYIKGLDKTPTDDMARVYAFAKVMDPNSVVRESEYKTVQDYSQAVLQAAGLKTKRIFTNSGFLTDEARGFINVTLDKKLKTQEQTYRNVYDEYGRRINKLTGSKDGTDYITDYSKGYGSASNDLITAENQAHQAVTDYGAAHPEARDKILSLAGVTQPDIGRAYTWQEIQQILGVQQ